MGILNKLIEGVFKIKQRAQLKTVAKNSSLKKLTKDAEEGLEDLNKYIAKRKKQGIIPGVTVPDSIKDLYK